MDNKDMPANPLNGAEGRLFNGDDGWPETSCIGLTKREYFAGLAMQGNIACQSEVEGYYRGDAPLAYLAKISIEQADALLKALEESNG